MLACLPHVLSTAYGRAALWHFSLQHQGPAVGSPVEHGIQPRRHHHRMALEGCCLGTTSPPSPLEYFLSLSALASPPSSALKSSSLSSSLALYLRSIPYHYLLLIVVQVAKKLEREGILPSPPKAPLFSETHSLLNTTKIQQKLEKVLCFLLRSREKMGEGGEDVLNDLVTGRNRSAQVQRA